MNCVRMRLELAAHAYGIVYRDLSKKEKKRMTVLGKYNTFEMYLLDYHWI